MSTLILLLLVILGGVAVVISWRPDEFRVSRSTVIKAPPHVVFEQINDLHKWDAWSPWAKLDPNAQHNFSGAPAGVGAAMSWAGNNKVGVGKLTITDSRPFEFEKPMKTVNTAEFSLQPSGEGTQVAWTMSGTNNFVGKAISLFMNCEKMVGGQFDQGLASMKSIAERASLSAP
jgi:Polyketide cyclase / dehydrase and lipid transport